MNAELIAILGIGVAILGVGASLAALTVGGQRSIRAELAGIRTDLQNLGERVARLEGALSLIAAAVPDEVRRSGPRNWLSTRPSALRKATPTRATTR